MGTFNGPPDSSEPCIHTLEPVLGRGVYYFFWAVNLLVDLKYVDWTDRIWGKSEESMVKST